jgi:hypothetical protein
MADTTSAAPAASSTPSETPSDTTNTEEKAPGDVGLPSPDAEAKEAKAKAEADAKKEVVKSNKKKYKLKVDKNEEDFELDLDNDEEVKKHLQKSRASDKRFQEAAEVRKAAIDFIEELKKNPRKVLSDPNINVDLKKFAEEIINEHIKELEKSPEQREKEALTAELEKLKKESKEREEAAKKSEFEKLQLQQEHELSSQIEAALDVGGLPKHPRTVKAMAEMMMIALQNDIDLSPQDIAPIVKNNTMGEFKEIIQALSDDQLEDFLGKEILGRLQKKRVAKSPTKTAQTVNNIQATSTTKESKKDDAVKKQTIRQWLKV